MNQDYRPLLPRTGLLRDQLQRPLRDLRLSVTDRCNFRCPYCMPRERFHAQYRFLTSSERLTFPELLRLTRLFAQLGVVKLRITGGEPLLRPDLSDLIGDLTSLAGIEDVALTTNGVLLAQHAAALKAAGLQRVTVSLDSIDPDTFARMSGGFGQLDEVLKGIDAAHDAGLVPIKVNTVVQRGVNDHQILDLLQHFRGTGVIVRLIEYMDVGNRNDWEREQVVPSQLLLERIAERWDLTALEPAYAGEVARRYRFDDDAGEIGFISSVTQPFCGDCSRARLSSDGVFYTCLFAANGTDLRAPLRGGASDDDLLSLIRAVWQERRDRYSELREQLRARGAQHVEMNYVGG
ncbi:MAG TPA: GTP 3',8-cyclase MoaA [Steroidobacteraceae bacterium]|jgi:cyclic pyranopterin phosphate synthase|nr:GTP 3',8-cyclase MoaA [Steroidobacteraceae bacterium]